MVVVVGCWLVGFWFALVVACCPLPAGGVFLLCVVFVRCLLFAVWCLLCVLCVVCWLLFAVCCLACAV